MKIIATIMIAATMCIGAAVHAQELKRSSEAQEAASRWLTLTDGGNYGASWDQASGAFQAAITRAGWETLVKPVRAPLGAVKSRKLKSAVFARTLPGAPEGEYFVVQYDTEFENHAGAVETVTPMRDKDGAWRVSGYYIK